MHFDKAFIIGLPDHTNKRRLDRSFERCEREGVKMKLWNGIYGPDVDIPVHQAKGYLSDDFELKLPGSLGCMLSHITLWESVEKDPDCDIAFICEDDILLNKNFLKDLEAIPWSDVPEDWDIIKLSCGKLKGESISQNIVQPNYGKSRGLNSGMFCYLFKSSSAQKIKNILVPYNGSISMDVILRNNFNKFNIYILKNKLANVARYRYSIRKDLNLEGQKGLTLKKVFFKITKFLFP